MRIVRVHGAWFTDKGHTIAAGGGTRLKTIWRVFFAGCPWCAPAAAESSGCTPFASRDRSESVSQASTIVGIGRSRKTTWTSLPCLPVNLFPFFFFFVASIRYEFSKRDRDRDRDRSRPRIIIIIVIINSDPNQNDDDRIRWGFDHDFTAIANSVAECER